MPIAMKARPVPTRTATAMAALRQPGGSGLFATSGSYDWLASFLNSWLSVLIPEVVDAADGWAVYGGVIPVVIVLVEPVSEGVDSLLI